MAETIVIHKNNPSLREVHLVYTSEEADNEGIEYKSWKDAQVGEYGISDDGYVAICRKRLVSNKGTALCVYPYGKGSISRKGAGFLLRYDDRRRWDRTEAKRNRTKRAIQVYCTQVLAGRVDWDVVGRAYRPDQKVPAATVKRLFKRSVIKSMIDKELKALMEQEGITEKYVLEIIKKAIEIASKKNDPGNMLKAASELSDMLNMKPKKSTVTDRLEIDMTKEISDRIATESRHMLISSEREEDVPILPED